MWGEKKQLMFEKIFHRMRGIESIFRVAEKTIFAVVKSFY